MRDADAALYQAKIAGRGRGDRFLAINLSQAEVLDAGVLRRLSGAVDGAGVSAHRLALEVGEGTYMDAVGSAARILQELRQEGFRLLIDQFGTGYTSFQTLEEFPVDGIKLSGKLTAAVGQSPATERTLEGILAFTHSVGTPVIATAVETPAQLAFFEGHGVDLAQGNLLAPPRPMAGVVPQSYRLTLLSAAR